MTKSPKLYGCEVIRAEGCSHLQIIIVDEALGFQQRDDSGELRTLALPVTSVREVAQAMVKLVVLAEEQGLLASPGEESLH